MRPGLNIRSHPSLLRLPPNPTAERECRNRTGNAYTRASASGTVLSPSSQRLQGLTPATLWHVNCEYQTPGDLGGAHEAEHWWWRGAGAALPTRSPIKTEDRTMLSTIAVVLLALWLLGLVTSYTMGGFIHVLLVIAVIVVLMRIIQGRRIA
jgi:Family of unknown function (DUF5670)